MIKLIKWIDTSIGVVLAGACGWLRRKKEPARNPKNILVIQLWGIGESILVLPFLAEVKKKFPDAKLDVLTTLRAVDIFYKRMEVDRIRLINFNPLSLTWFMMKNARSYDLVID